MGVTVAWDNTEKTIMRFDYTGDWTWDDFDAVEPDLQAMMDSVDHQVDTIVVLETSSVPLGALARFSTIVNSPSFTHPNAGLTVVVGASGLARALADIFGKAHKQTAAKIAMASTLEEAYAIIAEHRRLRGSQ